MEPLREYFASHLLYHLVIGSLLIVLSFPLGKFFKFFLNNVVRKITERTKTELDNRIMEVLVDKVFGITVVAGFYFGTEQIRAGITSHNPSIMDILRYIDALWFIVFLSILTIVITRILNTVVLHTLHRYATREDSILDRAAAPLITRLVSILIGAIAITIILGHFGENISSLVLSLGVGSLAIALGAQETIANMIAGFVIMIDRPFRIGDRVQLPSGEIGDVIDIGLRSTRILDFNHNVIISPNAELIKGKIINFSYPERHVRLKVNVGVAYGSDIQKVKKNLLSVAHKQSGVLPDPPPNVLLTNLGDSALEFSLLCRTDDYKNKSKIEEELRVNIYEAFQREGIEIPFPQRVVHLSNASTDHEPKTSKKRKTVRR